MFTYVCLGTNDLERAIRFYNPVMQTLGQQRCDNTPDGTEHWEGWAGWGRYEHNGLIELALWVGKPFNQQVASIGNGSMIAFKADSWRVVREFHAAAIQHGGSSDGEPGLRTHYNDDFYACYVRDPDNNKLAAVCRGLRQE
ncbi:MAG: VOC family protein [Steroidobacteraceae bacterium]